MTAVVVILGRPNVGKSSLFNRLTASKDALVGEEAGLTRDLRFGLLAPAARSGARREDSDEIGGPVLVDTGGLKMETASLQAEAARLAWAEAEKADLVLFLTDASSGPTGFDEEILTRLRRSGRPLLLVANKVDRATPVRVQSDHAHLGLGEPLPVSARSGRGLNLLRRRLRELADRVDTEPAPPGKDIVLTGRPNAGKSTLLNALCEDSRALVADEPGTTRDDVAAPFELGGERYRLLDTAGVQRRWRTASPGHALAAARSLARLDRALAVVHLVDAEAGLAGQDRRLIGRALEQARPLLLASNKMDLLDERQRKSYRLDLKRALDFAPFVPHCPISARTGEGLDQLKEALQQLLEDSQRTVGTAQVNRILQRILDSQPPPTHKGRRPKLRYAHPVSGNPLQIRIFGTACERVPDSYKRFLEKAFGREIGTLDRPVRVSLRSVENPYVRTRKGSAPPRRRSSQKSRSG